ncbi:amino acid ABC transporter ATP-binding protein [Acinetobacter pittii]|uniref:amino acid ABC transporter ATP-binding protein n=1 Tax=Acinetobacter pittii TaxID=48296 RepID=UPI00355C15FD
MINYRNPPILTVDGLSKSYGGKKILNNVSFNIQNGEVVGILGRSGSGKSTLLRCLNYLEHPDEGNIFLNSEKIGFNTNGKIASSTELALQRSKMSMVFQHFNLWVHKTVLENIIEGPIWVKGQSKAEAELSAHKLLNQIGLQNKANAYPITLSGGQQQRVSIARALAMEPQVILFDEPTSALDPELVNEVLSVMSELARNGTTMLLVTHEIRFAMQVCDRILYLSEGEIVAEGTPKELLARDDRDEVKQFLISAGIESGEYHANI